MKNWTAQRAASVKTVGANFESAEPVEGLFKRGNPVERFFAVEHELEKQHEKERAAERGNPHVGVRKMRGVLVGIVQSQVENRPARNSRKRRDNHNREDETHSENRYRNAPS